MNKMKSKEHASILHSIILNLSQKNTSFERQMTFVCVKNNSRQWHLSPPRKLMAVQTWNRTRVASYHTGAVNGGVAASTGSYINAALSIED